METGYIERIKQLKSERKMTNEDLAAASGVPLGTLSKLLAGVSDSVKLSNMVSICDALGVSLDYVVSGIPENNNNFTLDGTEIRLIEDFRRLDPDGRELVLLVTGKERERAARAEYPAAAPKAPAAAAGRTGRILAAPDPRRYRDSDAGRRAKRQIPLYDLPVSAGPGEYLDGTGSSAPAGLISIPAGGSADDADFALRISGNSMEPKYHNGDVLLVENTDAVEVGEPCVYVLDGNGYFKIFGGDCLISLNPEYGRIPLGDFETVTCMGRVLGRVRKK